MTVSEVLEQRLRSGEPRVAVTALSLLGHGIFILLLALISRPRPPAFVPIALPVRVVSPSALYRPTAPPAPAPAPAPEPERKPRPVLEKANEAPPPSAKAMPAPKAKKVKPAPAPQPAPSIDLPSAGGSAAGAAGGLSFGTSVEGLDVDFPFSYYVEQILSLIGANWFKPDVPEGTACIVAFRIQRSGQVTDVRLDASSGLPFYDRAAVRAVYSANPLPPLPSEFQGDQLGVRLRFR